MCSPVKSPRIVAQDESYTFALFHSGKPEAMQMPTKSGQEKQIAAYPPMDLYSVAKGKEFLPLK